MNRVCIGDVITPVESWDPGVLPQATYIDIAAIDRETKQISNSRVITAATAPSRARQLVRANDVLVSTVRPNLNAVAWVPPEHDGSVASTGFAVLRSVPGRIEPRYLYHWVRSAEFVAEMTRLATGASYPAVSEDTVKASRIPDPGLGEQRRIASILDEVEKITGDSRRRFWNDLQKLSESCFLSFFGNCNFRHLPWKETPLHYWVEPSRPITYGILKPGEYEPDGVPMLRVQDIQNGLIDMTQLHLVSSKLSRQYSRSILEGGEILISLVGTVGRCALVPPTLRGGNIHRNLALVVPRADVGAEYLLQFLQSSPGQERIRACIKGGNQQLLNLTELRTIPIPTPPLRLQLEYQGVYSQIKVLTDKAEQLLVMGRALSNVLSVRGFSGSI